MILPSEPPKVVEPVSLAGAGSLLMRALETLVVRERWAFGAAALLFLPVATLLGGLATLALDPFFRVVQTLETDPFALLQAMHGLQHRSIVIYAFLLGLGSWILSRFCAGLLRLVVISGLSASWIESRRGLEQVYLRALPLLAPYLKAWCLRELLIGLGLLALGLPGVFAWLFLSQVEVVVLLEGRPAFDALKRSSRLMDRRDTVYRFTTLAFYLSVLGYGADAGVEILWKSLLGAPGSFVSLALQDALVLTLLVPVEAAASLVFYTDLRTRQRTFEQSLARFMDMGMGETIQRVQDE